MNRGQGLSVGVQTVIVNGLRILFYCSENDFRLEWGESIDNSGKIKLSWVVLLQGVNLAVAG